MNKRELYFAMASTTLAAAFGAGQSQAQDIDSNFNRNTSVSVTDRANQNNPSEGIPVGSFLLFPTLGAAAGYNDNVFYVDTGKQSDSFLELTPEVDIRSQWTRNSLSAGIKGDFVDYSKFSSQNQADWSAYADGRYDVSSQVNVIANVTHSHTYEGLDSTGADLTELQPVQYDTNSGELGVVLTGNRLRFTGTYQASEDDFQNVRSSGPGGIDVETIRNDRNQSYSGRLDYALSPDISIYGTAIGNQHQYPNLVGYNSTGSTFAIGSSFDLNHLMRGHIEIGDTSQNYSSASVGKQTSGYFNGSVEWFPTELTTVTGTANRSIYDTPYLGDTATSIDTTGSLAVDHELLRNLILSGKISESQYQYKGISRNDRVGTITAGAKYYVNRHVYISAAYANEKYTSTGAQAYRNFTDNTFRVTLGFRY